MGESSDGRFKLGTRGKESVLCRLTDEGDHELFVGKAKTSLDELLKYDEAGEVKWERLGVPARLKELKAEQVAEPKEKAKGLARFNERLRKIEHGFYATRVGMIVYVLGLVFIVLAVVIFVTVAVLGWADGFADRIDGERARPVEMTETVTISRAEEESTGSAAAMGSVRQKLSSLREDKVSRVESNEEAEGLYSTATVVTVVGALLTLLGSIVSDAVKRSSDNKKSVEESKLKRAKNEEDSRAKLRVVLRAMDLLHEKGKDARTYSLQIEGVILALAKYDIKLALDLVGRLPWVQSCDDTECEEYQETTPSITWEVAARLLEEAFDSADKDARNVAAWLLCKNYKQISAFDGGCRMGDERGAKRFLAPRTRIWPIPGPGWRVGLRGDTAGLLIKAASRWLAYELERARDTIPQPALVLFEALDDPRPFIKDIAAQSLEPLLYDRETTDTSRGVWSLNPLVRQDPLREDYDPSYSAVFLVTIDDMRQKVSKALCDGNSEACIRNGRMTIPPLSERSLRLRVAVEEALNPGESPRYLLGAGPPVALPSTDKGGRLPAGKEPDGAAEPKGLGSGPPGGEGGTG